VGENIEKKEEKEKNIWEALGVPPGASNREIVGAWDRVREEKLRELQVTCFTGTKVLGLLALLVRN
jgi:hypothetical protein